MKRLVLILAATTALAACEDGTRREYLYKPAYCLASGLANMTTEECLPANLKEDTAAIAAAKLADRAAAQPSPELQNYYTKDQRLSMGYSIAEALFAPTKKVTDRSITMSLEANGILNPGKPDEACGAQKARDALIKRVHEMITPVDINRETAKFLAEHYTDVQLAELYRVAQSGGDLRDVNEKPFIVPDPKDAKKTINTTPKNGTALGTVLSYTTSLTASTLVKQRQPEIESDREKFKTFYATKAQEKGEACGIELPNAPQAPQQQEVPAPATGEGESK